MSDTKKIEGAAKKAERTKAKELLITLKGIAIPNMSKKQLDDYLTAVGLLLGIVDTTGVIK